MTYLEMKEEYKDCLLIYNRTGSPFYLRKMKLLELAIKDAIEYKHSDCTDI